MKQAIKRVSFVISAALISLVVVGEDRATTWWKGEDGAYLNDAANWDGDAPFSVDNTNNMGFKGVPSDYYTVKLSEDLVCGGSWMYEYDHPKQLTYDLGGHTLTFLSEYHSHSNRGVTNFLTNGTIAYTNAAGSVQNLVIWSTNPGYTLRIKDTGSFIGNIIFQDNGPKNLFIEPGGKMRGALCSRGGGCRVYIDGKGAVLDVNFDEFNIGGQGAKSQAYITDGAIVSNVTDLALGGGGNGGYCEGGESYLCISNATLIMSPKNAFRETFYIGRSGNGKINHQNRMDVIGGAHFLAESIYQYGAGWENRFSVGDGYSNSNVLYVAGAGTTFSNCYANGDRPLVAGQHGLFNRIHFTDHAVAYSHSISAGGQSKQYGDSCVTSLWNRVTVDDGAILVATNVQMAARHWDDRAFEEYLKSIVASNVFEVLEGGTLKCENTLTCGVLYPGFDNAFIARGKATVSIGNGGDAILVGQDGSYGNHFEVTDGASLTVNGNVRIGNNNAKGSNNLIRIDGCPLTENGSTINTLSIGYSGNAGNCLWVGTDTSMACDKLLMSGSNSEIILSNGTLRVGNGFYPNNNNDPETDGGSRLTFIGSKAKFKMAGGNGGVFTNQCAFVFKVPEGGYESAPVESNNAPLYFHDDTDFVFDFSAVSKEGLKNVPLIAYTGASYVANRLVISDELFAKMNAAAESVRQGSRVKFSADRRELSLRIGSQGLCISVR